MPVRSDHVRRVDELRSPRAVQLSRWEFLRKFRCTACGMVFMCACDEELARRCLPHQMSWAHDEALGRRVDLAGGFVPKACNTCRGLPEDPAPKAEGHGRSSKIHRYYWREIYKETQLRLIRWCDENKVEVKEAWRAHQVVVERIDAEVVGDVKRRHETDPKYSFSEPSQHAVLEQAGVEVINLDGTYIEGAGKDDPVAVVGMRMSVEEAAARHFHERGYEVMFLESLPFQAIYGVLMWLWVQSPDDPLARAAAFGGRDGVETDEHGMVWAMLPEDFGTRGHAVRRRAALDEHLEWLRSMEGLEWVFDDWVEPSRPLCAYLWAWQDPDIDRARTVMRVLGQERTLDLVAFMAEAYWDRYLGWPDLLVWTEHEYLLVEVKSSGDKLSTSQRSWMLENSTHLGLPVQLLKIHRTRRVTALDASALPRVAEGTGFRGSGYFVPPAPTTSGST